jgi:CRISPR-associated protein Csb2
VSTTLAVRFPLGRYHANPWDRAVNEGASEWPPSPWRILRTLVATWYTRWPELPAPELDRLLDAIADPPWYQTPPALAGHTRHYLPDLEHRTGEHGHTDLTLDPFLSVRARAELLVRWDADLDSGQREVLAKLAELVPYLGRAESVCEVRLLDEEAVPDDTWWRPGADGPNRARLLAVTRPLSRPMLEATTAEVRMRRRTMPAGTTWVTYACGDHPAAAAPASERESGVRPTAIRFAVLGGVPLLATHGVLLADEVHRLTGHAFVKDRVPDERRQLVMGTGGAGSDHQHAHWIAVPESGNRGSFCRNVVVWVPRGLRTDEVRAVLSLRAMSGRRGGENGYEVRGFPPVELLFQAAGPVEQVAPELCGLPGASFPVPVRRWRSRTPYLPVRHRKRETLDEYVAADVSAELRYRGWPTAEVSRLEHGTQLTDRWASEFRRHRLGEHRQQSRPGMGLRLEFASAVTGPLLLGQLSHFGFGLFVPE